MTCRLVVLIYLAKYIDRSSAAHAHLSHAYFLSFLIIAPISYSMHQNSYYCAVDSLALPQLVRYVASINHLSYRLYVHHTTAAEPPSSLLAKTLTLFHKFTKNCC
jgi:hypothetical protein